MIQKVSIHTLILIKHNIIRTFCTSILWDNSNLNFICPSYRTYTKEFEYSRKLRLHQFLQIRNLFNYQSLQIRDLTFYSYTTQQGSKYDPRLPNTPLNLGSKCSPIPTCLEQCETKDQLILWSRYQSANSLLRHIVCTSIHFPTSPL